MSGILNGISVVGSFLLLFSLLYFIQYYTLGLIPIFKKELKKKISIGDLVFCFNSLGFILLFVEFYKPY